MNTKLEQAKTALYGSDGLRATNFKLFPGSNRDVTAEQIAKQINTVVEALKNPDEEMDKIDI
jgi:hypothetical protein